MIHAHPRTSSHPRHASALGKLRLAHVSGQAHGQSAGGDCRDAGDRRQFCLRGGGDVFVAQWGGGLGLCQGADQSALQMDSRRRRHRSGSSGVSGRRHLCRQRDHRYVRHDHRRGDARACLFHRLHARRQAIPTILHLPGPVLLFDARPGHRRDDAPAFHLLGTGRPLLVSADRILVREEDCVERGHQSIHHQPRR